MVTTRATQLNNMTQASFSSDEILSYLLPDEKSGRKKTVKPTKEKLEDQICEFYDSIFGKDIEDTITLRSLYPAWIEFTFPLNNHY